MLSIAIELNHFYKNKQKMKIRSGRERIKYTHTHTISNNMCSCTTAHIISEPTIVVVVVAPRVL